MEANRKFIFQKFRTKHQNVRGPNGQSTTAYLMGIIEEFAQYGLLKKHTISWRRLEKAKSKSSGPGGNRLDKIVVEKVLSKDWGTGKEKQDALQDEQKIIDYIFEPLGISKDHYDRFNSTDAGNWCWPEPEADPQAAPSAKPAKAPSAAARASDSDDDVIDNSLDVMQRQAEVTNQYKRRGRKQGSSSKKNRDETEEKRESEQITQARGGSNRQFGGVVGSDDTSEPNVRRMFQGMDMRTNMRGGSVPVSGGNVATGYRRIDSDIAKFYSDKGPGDQFGDMNSMASHRSLQEFRQREAAFYGGHLHISLSSGRQVVPKQVHDSQRRREQKQQEEEKKNASKNDRRRSKKGSKKVEVDDTAELQRQQAQRRHLLSMQQSAGPNAPAPRRSSRLAAKQKVQDASADVASYRGGGRDKDASKRAGRSGKAKSSAKSRGRGSGGRRGRGSGASGGSYRR